MKLRSINVIFTGRYLYLWYIVFTLVVLSMLINLWILSSVEEFRLTTYDTSGAAVKTEIVTSDMLDGLTDPRDMNYTLEKGIEPYKSCYLKIFRYELCLNLVKGENS
jgi:hypothetical protein